MAIHSSTLAWKIPWTEEPGRLQSMGSWRVGHDWATFHSHALEKEMATHSSILTWRIPGAEEPGGMLSMGSHRVGHDWSNLVAAAAEPKDHDNGYHWRWSGLSQWLVEVLNFINCYFGFPHSSVGKESTCYAGDLGLIPGLGISPGEEQGYQLQYSGLENSLDYSPCGSKELDMTEWLSLNLLITILWHKQKWYK